MYYWWIIIIISVAVWIISWISEDDGCMGFMFGFMTFIVTGFISLCIASWIGCSEYESGNYVDKINFDTEIIALSDKSSVGGSFFLGCGSISDNMYYYYISNDTNGYRTHKIKAENAYVKYTDETPHIVSHSTDIQNEWGFYIDDYYVIWIPEGSILQQYSVDIQ